MDHLGAASRIAQGGLSAQSARMRVVAENIANANVTAARPGAEPYRRKMLTFESVLDRADLSAGVGVAGIERSEKPFRIEQNPGHPAADAEGKVALPNVDMLVEMADMAEANRSYLANLQVIKRSRELVAMTLELLRSP